MRDDRRLDNQLAGQEDNIGRRDETTRGLCGGRQHNNQPVSVV